MLIWRRIGQLLCKKHSTAECCLETERSEQELSGNREIRARHERRALSCAKQFSSGGLTSINHSEIFRLFTMHWHSGYIRQGMLSQSPSSLWRARYIFLRQVWMDGGIHSGQSVLKACALGAKGTLVGRPWLYGLGAYGWACIFQKWDEKVLCDMRCTDWSGCIGSCEMWWQD